MLLLNKEQDREIPARWSMNAAGWQSNMGIAPTAVPSGLLIVASGVDGREQGSIRRYLGHTLLEDPRRVAMTAGSDPAVSSLTFSAERVAETLDAGNAVIEDIYPFQISNHDTEGEVKPIRGFVVRMRNVLRSGVWVYDVADNDINWMPDDDRPFLGLLLLNEESDPGPVDSKFQFVVPLTPLRELGAREFADLPAYLPHYYDQYLPNFTMVDWFKQAGPSTPIFCENPITVSHNGRFLYVASTTGEFEPLTLWYDKGYGITGGDFSNLLMSNRSPG